MERWPILPLCFFGNWLLGILISSYVFRPVIFFIDVHFISKDGKRGSLSESAERVAEFVPIPFAVLCTIAVALALLF